MSVVLLGYRGSGKTTVGKRLASRLWQTFVDTDEMVVRSAGMPIAEIFAKHGEAHFRELEEQAVSAALLLEEHVISLGGGAVLRESVRARLKASGHKRIYLKAEPEVLAARLAGDPNTALHRPSLLGGGGGAGDLAEIRQVLEVREPIYREVMTAELDVSNLSPEDATVYIVRLM